MGCYFSSLITKPPPQPTAKVVGLDGSLSEHPVPVTVSKVLGINRLTCFLCNCDAIQADDCLSPLDLSEDLDADRIYFVIPKTKLKYRLTGADMAALAVKATTALSVSSSSSGDGEAAKAKKKKKKTNKKSSQVANGKADDDDGDKVGTLVRWSSSSSTAKKKKVISRSLSSGLAKTVRRSFRRILSTIDEANE